MPTAVTPSPAPSRASGQTSHTAKAHLVGVDWMRAIAAFAVVASHTPFNAATTGITTDQSAVSFLEHCRFHVPFFFATAFAFFSTGKNSMSDSIAARIQRLLVPFAFWSAVYLVLQVAKTALTTGSLRFPNQDVAALLCGGAAVHLYFLPMLFVGAVAGIIAQPLLTRLPSTALLAICTITIGTSYLLRATGNDFNMAGSRAFMHLAGENQSPLLRVSLVCIAWTVTLLPYICFGAWLNGQRFKDLVSQRRPILATTLFVLFVGHNTFLLTGEITAPVMLLGGLIAFAFAASISSFLADHTWIRRLGAWTFGIYLIHVIPVQVAQLILARFILPPGAHFSLGSLLALTALAFAVSAFACWLVERRGGNFLRNMIGLRA